MSFAPETLLDLRDYLKGETGLSDNELGIVGDSNHTYGYHLGEDRLPKDDYSARTKRDIAGLSDAASASDIGMFDRLVELTDYLVAEGRAGRASDIREIIGPAADGRAYRYDSLSGWAAQLRSPGDPHEWHTHVSWYRDSEFRDKTALFQRFFDTGGGWLMALTDEQQEDLYRRVKNLDSAMYYGDVLGEDEIPASEFRFGFGQGTAADAPVPYVLMRKLDEVLAALKTGGIDPEAVRAIVREELDKTKLAG